MIHQTSRSGLGRGERGEGKLGPILALLVVAFVVYMLVMYVPTRISKAELEGALEDHTREYVVQQLTYEQLIETIIAEAEELGINISEEQVVVDDGSREVRTTVRYTTVLDMLWGEWALDYQVDATVPKL